MYINIHTYLSFICACGKMIEDMLVEGMSSHDQKNFQASGLRKLMNSMVFRKPQSQRRYKVKRRENWIPSWVMLDLYRMVSEF